MDGTESEVSMRRLGFPTPVTKNGKESSQKLIRPKNASVPRTNFCQLRSQSATVIAA